LELGAAGVVPACVDDVAAELELLGLELPPHAAATNASGTSNRAGDLTRASFGVDARLEHPAYAGAYQDDVVMALTIDDVFSETPGVKGSPGRPRRYLRWR
jgi:hypothetical protein